MVQLSWTILKGIYTEVWNFVRWQKKPKANSFDTRPKASAPSQSDRDRHGRTRLVRTVWAPASSCPGLQKEKNLHHSNKGCFSLLSEALIALCWVSCWVDQMGLCEFSTTFFKFEGTYITLVFSGRQLLSESSFYPCNRISVVSL